MKKQIFFIFFILLNQFLSAEEVKLKYAGVLEYNNILNGYLTIAITDKAVDGKKGLVTLLDSNFKSVKETYVDFKNTSFVQAVVFNGESILCLFRNLNSDKYDFISFDLNLKKAGEFEDSDLHKSSGLNISPAKNGFLFSYASSIKAMSGPTEPVKAMYSNSLKQLWKITPQQMPKSYTTEVFICTDGIYAFYTAVNRKDYSYALEVIDLNEGKLIVLIEDGIIANFASYNSATKITNTVRISTKNKVRILELNTYDASGKKINGEEIPWESEIDTRESAQKDPYKSDSYRIFNADSKTTNDNRHLLNFYSTSGSAKVSLYSLFSILISGENKLIKANTLDKKKFNFSDPSQNTGVGFGTKTVHTANISGSMRHEKSLTPTAPLNEYFFTQTNQDGSNPVVVYMEAAKKKDDLVPVNVVVAHIGSGGVTYEKFPVTDEPDACQVFPATGNRILILKYFKKDEKIAPLFVDLKK